jgi:hypothetical protein
VQTFCNVEDKVGTHSAEFLKRFFVRLDHHNGVTLLERGANSVHGLGGVPFRIDVVDWRERFASERLGDGAGTEWKERWCFRFDVVDERYRRR